MLSDNVNCTVPWTQSMMEMKMYNESFKPTCKDTLSISNHKSFGYQFSKQAAKYNNLKCLGKIIHYKIMRGTTVLNIILNTQSCI